MPDSITRQPGTMRPDRCKHQTFIKFPNYFCCSINLRAWFFFLLFSDPQGGSILQNKKKDFCWILIGSFSFIKTGSQIENEDHIGVTVPQKHHRRATVTPAWWFIIRPISSLPATEKTEARISPLRWKGRANFGYWKSLAAYDPDIKRWRSEGGRSDARNVGRRRREDRREQRSKRSATLASWNAAASVSAVHFSLLLFFFKKKQLLKLKLRNIFAMKSSVNTPESRPMRRRLEKKKLDTVYVG